MLESMTLDQFSEWEAVDKIQPIGNQGTHTTLALIGSLIASACGVKIPPGRFLPWTESGDEAVKASDAKALFKAAFGGD